jgi:uncharacterized membrane protein
MIRAPPPSSSGCGASIPAPERRLAATATVASWTVREERPWLSGRAAGIGAAEAVRLLPPHAQNPAEAVDLRTAALSTEDRGSADEVNGPRRSLIAGILLGVGVAAFIDETVFHQILHWHHFYDQSTPSWGLISDGLFHAFSWFCMVGGFFIFADLRRRAAWKRTWQLSGLLFGLGGFELYDGTIQHKLLRLHQIRYGVNIVPYDIVWNAIAVMILIGAVVALMRARREPGPPPPAVSQRPGAARLSGSG